jgi:hypothetical protein
MVAWLARSANLASGVATKRVVLSRELREMPTTRTAWLQGEISEAHVQRLAAARTPVTVRHFERDEGFLVEQAKSFRFSDFAHPRFCALAR